MLTRDYLYISGESGTQPQVAVIVLPEIYGPVDSIKRVADRFAREFGVLGVVLDHFFSVTGESKVLDYQTGRDEGMALMQQETGMDFLSLFDSMVDELFEAYPSLEKIVVCGFCFGGRLSYVAGVNPNVGQIFSFYGAGANNPNFVEKQSAIESLVSARAKDTGLHIMSFYGATDSTITADDRLHTRAQLAQAEIDYTEKIYPTGHAFFNEDRDTYAQTPARAAWDEIAKVMGHSSQAGKTIGSTSDETK